MRRAIVAIAAVAAAVVASCGGDDAAGPDAPAPVVGEIAPAVAALESELGGPQAYVEINADTRLVNLFVVSDDGTTATPYLYLDGRLEPPAPAQPVGEGATFTAAEMSFEPDEVLDRVADELPGSTMTRFVVLVGPEGELRYEVFVQSAQGGHLAVVVAGDGTVLGVEVI